MIVLNFSHPFAAEQISRLETLLGGRVDCMMDINTQVDPHDDLVPQVVALADSCQLTPTQWQTETILIVPPSLNFVAVTLLAELHGRMGYFPAHLRTRPVKNSVPTRFEIAEVMNLQSVRDLARTRR